MPETLTTRPDSTASPRRDAALVESRWGGLTARLATDKRVRTDAFALRYRSYRAGGYIDPRPDELFFDPFDDQIHCTTIVVYDGPKPIGSVRVCLQEGAAPANPAHVMPVAHVFPEEVPAIFGTERDGRTVRRAVEINRLVRDPDHATDQLLVFALFRMAGCMILHFDTDAVISCVRRNHVPFYQRLLFTPLAGPRRYPNLNFDTTLLACFRSSYDRVRWALPVLDAGETFRTEYCRLIEGQEVRIFPQA